MKRICITGGIACGKSMAGRIIARMGVPVIEADDVCHSLMRRGAPLARRVAAGFGPGILDERGDVDRRKLGRIVFFDERSRARLNAILHPAARRVIAGWLRTLSGGRGSPGRGAAVAVVPLLYEARWERDWDCVICVFAPYSFQIERLRAKGLSAKEARARVAAQMPLAEKMSRADYVLVNTGKEADLRMQIESVFRSIEEQSEKFNGR